MEGTYDKSKFNYNPPARHSVWNQVVAEKRNEGLGFGTMNMSGVASLLQLNISLPYRGWADLMSLLVAVAFTPTHL